MNLLVGGIVCINKKYTFPFHLTDCPFLFHFFCSFNLHLILVPVPFHFSPPLILCGKDHSACVNSCFAESKFHVVNYMYVATCSHRRTWLSQVLGRTLAMVFSEYRTEQTFGRGKYWRIWRMYGHLPKFSLLLFCALR